MSNLLTALTLFSLTASGIVGGVFFIFSTTFMPVLGTRPWRESIEAMKQINEVIVRNPFIALFIGNALAALVLIGTAIFDLQRPGAWFTLSGAAAYLLGSFLVTLVFNVPRNNALAAVSSDDSAAAEGVWNDYRREWTLWNHVRTVACILSTILLATSLLYR